MCSSLRQFPVLGRTGSVKFVKWDLLDEAHANKIHYQSLDKLASRGGLSWEELYLNYYKLPLSHLKNTDSKLWKEMVDNISC